MKKIALGLCLIALFGACKKKAPATEPPAPSPATATAQHADPATDKGIVAPQADDHGKAESANVPDTKGEQSPTLAPARPPIAFSPYIMPVPHEMWQGKSPEEIEKTILLPFADNERKERLRIWSEQAQMGLDEAKENYARDVFARSQTDSYYKTAIQYVESMRVFTDPSVLRMRIHLDLMKLPKDAAPTPEITALLDRLLAIADDESLQTLMAHPELGYQGKAVAKAREMYAASGNPEQTYRLARILQKGTDAEQAEARQLLELAAEKGQPDALYQTATSQIQDEATWPEAMRRLDLAAQKGSAEAALMRTELYIAGAFSDDAADAAESFGMPLTESAFHDLRNTVQKDGNPRMTIVESAHQVRGTYDLCNILLGISIMPGDDAATHKAREYFIECLDQVIDEKPPRTLCDRVFELAMLAPFDDQRIEDYYDESQRSDIGKLILRCYENDFKAGLDFAENAPYVSYSTAFQLASLYAGNESLRIDENPDMMLAYVVYSAYHSDLVGQFALGKLHEVGIDFPKDILRACFWYQRIASSYVCKTFCGDNPREFSACLACSDANEMLVECRKH